ncbi:MAG: hypothetical protein AB8E15_09730 [Bdellovibrionales bacterium]
MKKIVLAAGSILFLVSCIDQRDPLKVSKKPLGINAELSKSYEAAKKQLTSDVMTSFEKEGLKLFSKCRTSFQDNNTSINDQKILLVASSNSWALSSASTNSKLTAASPNQSVFRNYRNDLGSDTSSPQLKKLNDFSKVDLKKYSEDHAIALAVVPPKVSKVSFQQLALVSLMGVEVRGFSYFTAKNNESVLDSDVVVGLNSILYKYMNGVVNFTSLREGVTEVLSDLDTEQLRSLTESIGNRLVVEEFGNRLFLAMKSVESRCVNLNREFMFTGIADLYREELADRDLNLKDPLQMFEMLFVAALLEEGENVFTRSARSGGFFGRISNELLFQAL